MSSTTRPSQSSSVVIKKSGRNLSSLLAEFKRISTSTLRGLSGSDILSSYSPNVDLTHLKALYDRQIQKAITGIEIKPVLTRQYSKHHRNSGFNIVHFVINDDEGSQKQTKTKFSQGSSDINYSEPLDQAAVFHSLLKKNKSFTAMLEKVRSEMVLFSENESRETTTAWGSKKGNAIFRGEINAFIKPKFEFQKEQQVVENLSCMAIQQSNIAQNISMTDIYGWPWLDFSDNVRDLYGHADQKPVFDITSQYCPRLKSPQISHTLKRYLETAEPCVSIGQFEKTKETLHMFLQKHGKCLHKKIFDLAQTDKNWIYHSLPNHGYSYFDHETPLLNLGIIAPFCHDVWPAKDDSGLSRAVAIIMLATEFWNIVRTQKLKPIKDEFGQTIDMRQFLLLFSSNSTPGFPKSENCSYMKRERDGLAPRHIIVAYRGFLFVMAVVDENYQPLAPIHIANSVKGLIQFIDSGHRFPQEGINVLTSADSQRWSELRQHLYYFGQNVDAIKDIDHAMFLLSLDHMSVNTLDMLANESLFADGCNRWYDKALNFYVSNNGYVTVNTNSRIIDGSTVAYLLHYMHLRILEESQVWDDDLESAMGSSESLECVNFNLANLIKQGLPAELTINKRLTEQSLNGTDLRLLDFTVDEKGMVEIFKCSRMFRILSAAVDTSVCKLDYFDRPFFVDYRINKDAFAHLAMQLTFFKMHFRSASVGCRVSVKKFVEMRYDILRSTTTQMSRWCKAFFNSDIGKHEKDALFWAAHDKHVELLLEIHNGKGYDNHLNAMRNITSVLNLDPAEDIFQDDAFFQSGGGDHYQIFSETLGVGCTSCPVLLPCIPNGYGVGYCVANSFLMFSVTSWDEDDATSASLFTTVLKDVCQQLIASPPSKETRMPKKKNK